MKANEIMIGDWVLMDLNYSEEGPMYTQPNYQPYKIQNGEDIDLACETNCIGDADVYQPIPITPDILFANGFISKPFFAYVSADGRITLDPSTPNYPRQWNVHIDNEDYQSIASCDLDYLHQLQHLLRICNIEINWEL